MTEDILEIYQNFSGEETNDKSFEKAFNELIDAVHNDSINNIQEEIDISDNTINDDNLLWEFIHLNITQTFIDYEEFEPVNLLA